MKNNSLVKFSGEGIQINGEYKTLLCASLFYFRIPRGLWEKRILDLLSTGYDTADVYFPWNFHETNRGEWDFDGEKDVDEFLRLCAKHGLYVVARPGPYICSEWSGGALPSWVCGADYKARSSDPRYLKEARKWFGKILPIIKKYEIGNGGSVIMLQLENELDFFDCPDVEGYIGALRDYAIEEGITVPYFCCSGQGNTIKAGGLVEGVYPTFNFYPQPTSPVFDFRCRAAGLLADSKDFPLIITETGRQHSILKRELCSGAKLLGPYNQVAGSNFGFTQSINNWGKGDSPVSMITTVYDFNSMITTLGDFNEEAAESRLFSGMIKLLGEGLARARVDGLDDIFCSNNLMDALRLGGLRLHGGGRLLCIANIGEESAEFDIATPNGSFTVSVGAEGGTSAHLLGYPLKAHGIDGVIDYANCEPLDFSSTELVFYTDGNPDVKMTIGGKNAVVIKERSGEVNGIKVTVLTKKEAVSKVKGDIFPLSSERKSEFVKGGLSCDYKPPVRLVAAPSKTLTMECNDINHGMVIYKVKAKKGSEVLLYNAADFVTAYIDNKYKDTEFMCGGSKNYQPSKSGNYTFRIEKWGHCNFDDSRRPSLLLQSSRGVQSIFNIEKRVRLNAMRLKLPEKVPHTWSKKIDVSHNDFDPFYDPNGWQSTRKPLVCVYSAYIEAPAKGEQVALGLDKGTADCAVYIDGTFVAQVPDYNRFVFLNKALKNKQKPLLSIVARKKDFAERVGKAELLYLTKTKVSMSAYGEKELSGITMESGAKAFDFPLNLKPGVEKLVCINLADHGPDCCFGIIEGRGYKATVVLGGRVIARMVSPDTAIAQTGGHDKKFYIPSVWRADNKLYMYIEAIGDESCIESFGLEYNEKKLSK